MSELLTAEELDKLRKYVGNSYVADFKLLTKEVLGLQDKLLAAAEECKRLRAGDAILQECMKAIYEDRDRLRAAIELHRKTRRPSEIVAGDRELWAALG